MQSPRKKFLVLIFLCFFGQFLEARQTPFGTDSTSHREFILETSVGTGFVNNEITRFSASFRAGYDHYVLTARFIRSDRGANYIFENNWLAGYRFNLTKNFNTTVAAGFGDVAFDFEYGSYRENLKYHGFGVTLDAEMQWEIPYEGIASAWSLFGNYYTTFNSYANLNGFAAGFSFSPNRIRSGFFNQTAEKHITLVIEREEEKHERKNQKAIDNAGNWEHSKSVHWETSAFGGVGDKRALGGFESFFEYRRTILGANMMDYSPREWTEIQRDFYGHPFEYSYKTKQQEKAIFAGYRICEGDWFGVNLIAGISWRRTILLGGAGPHFQNEYHYLETRTKSGLLLQSEESYTFHNRRFGIGLTEYVVCYPDITTTGIAFSMRVGILR